LPSAIPVAELAFIKACVNVRVKTPVVCIQCSGTGAMRLNYESYTGRVYKSGVRVVHFSRGSFIGTGVGATGNAMTYEEFQRKFPEPRF
jgi:hypothetical protein